MKDGENDQRHTDHNNLAADGVTVHRPTIQCTLHKEKLLEVSKSTFWTSQLHLGIRCC